MDKNTKIIVGAIIVIAVIAVGYVVYKGQNNPISNEPIKIGFIGHLSGEYASYGVPMKNAVQLAVEEVNKNGGINKRQAELIVEDDGTAADKAASAMNKLVNIDKVNYIISGQGSGPASAITPIAQNNKKILMITLASAPGLTKAKDYVFRSIPSDVYQGVRMVELINNNLKSKKVAGLYVNDAYGAGIKEIINNNKNVENVDSELFEAGAIDFRTNLLKIKQTNADTLVLVAREEFPIILKQINELKLKMNIIASETFKDEKILKDSSSYVEGVITFMAQPTDYVDFANRYKTRFNEVPSAYSMYAYDGAMALIKAIKLGDNVEAVKSELSKTEFNGASGKVGFDNEGGRTGAGYIIYQVKNGQFVQYEE